MIDRIAELARCGLEELRAIRRIVGATPGTSEASGILKSLSPGETSVLLTACCQCPHPKGMATVQIWEQNETPFPAGDNNARLVIGVRGSTGRAKVEAFVDATGGTTFTINARDGLVLTAIYDNALPGILPLAGPVKRVEASVVWHGTIDPQPAYFSSPMQALAAGATGGEILIPDMARRVFIVDDQGGSPTSVLSFVHSPSGSTIYSATGPTPCCPAPVVLGAERVRVTSGATAAARVGVVWELYL